MGKKSNTRNVGERLRELLAELERLFNPPPRPIPVRVPARIHKR